MRKFAMASSWSGLARTDSVNHDSVTIFYATALGEDQLTVRIASMFKPVLSKSPLPDIENDIERSRA